MTSNHGKKKGKKHQEKHDDGTVTITPDLVHNGDPYPKVCIEGFPANTFINVLVPELSYGFQVNESNAGMQQCHQPAERLVDLDPGTYEVQSDVFDLIPGGFPQNGRSGPTVTLIVE
jgi:hypothetical protein